MGRGAGGERTEHSPHGPRPGAGREAGVCVETVTRGGGCEWRVEVDTVRARERREPRHAMVGTDESCTQTLEVGDRSTRKHAIRPQNMEDRGAPMGARREDGEVIGQGMGREVQGQAGDVGCDGVRSQSGDGRNDPFVREQTGITETGDAENGAAG